ncbi:MAG: hypothetical protein N2Z62_02570 [Rhodobacteraceae bacterium]|nr:hypothetical protein [Paracoccaceae bacterium]
MTPAEVAAFFTHGDGSYRFARWVRPIVPFVVGGGEGFAACIRHGLAEVAAISGHPAEPEGAPVDLTWAVLGVERWRDLPALPGAEAAIPGLAALATRLEAQDATQFRSFRRAAAGGIAGVTTVLRLPRLLERFPAEVVGVRQAVLAHLTWSVPKLTSWNMMDEAHRLRPEMVALLRAAYAPGLPAAADDAGHAACLAAAMSAAA